MAGLEDCVSSIEGPPEGPDPFWRTCTKVLIHRLPIGRAIDLNRMDGYDDLIIVLEDLFGIWGEIRGAIGVWSIVYLNRDGETVVLTDTPWPEFRSVVQKIVLYSTEELMSMMMAATMPLISGTQQ
ncbi:hypothetical protein AMTR_s00036p00215270 [Amborella trichopoda]|uniref:PB1 domain-containing protein n=1 Tax=Amborella trichopoda TaxID=13333 RepID=U5CZJ9_AMBTC|nr:hypothetical protein AMTR_s00036p00215270 [Amborella trichopoda]